MTAASSAVLSSLRGTEWCKPNSIACRPNKPLTSNSATAVSFPRDCRRTGRAQRILCSVSMSNPVTKTGRPDDLVASILAKVTQTDRGVSLTNEQHKQVAEVAAELQKYCVPEPVKNPLIFGEWDVAYCSNPTSPGGGYRSSLGRLVFRTKEMTQAVEAPDTIRNKVSFSALGFLDGEVSLKGKLMALDDNWIQVIFEPPQLKVGSLEFQYGGESEVKLQIIYVDEKIRLGKGSRGSLFVFQRC
ncbi:putative plastid-lipid-associated protein 8, chloroplastic [Turnera subulata]|uniref:Plastid-lipid-associated protein 8, chloroplastic n=1 Tax=Turnera subulata TaxID=218843 RepID=A0A9Q0FLA1_9ROSI|nr:putative plastid-lipid-associated protein 8, chloroplastic [Turnera subulata]